MKESNAALIQVEDSYDPSYQYNISKTSKDINAHQLYSLPFNYNEASDETLVSLYVNTQDEEAFNQIVERYNDIIIGFAMKLCRNTQDAQEIKQDVFLILVKKLHTFKGKSKFSTWLYRVTLNTCYKYLNDSNKRAKKEIILDESLLIQSQNHPQWNKRPDEIALIQETINLIGGAVSELTDSNKKIFNLKEIKGFSNAEVGEFMGISISAVKSRVLRTRLTVKEKISDYFKTA